MTTETDDRPLCRGCSKPLRPENLTMADGCPCNSPRGINHGIVRPDACTCAECDPKLTGASRLRLCGACLSMRATVDDTGRCIACRALKSSIEKWLKK